MRWFRKRKAVAAESRQTPEQRRLVAEVRAKLVDGSMSTEEAVDEYLAILYPGGGPVRGSFGDWDRSRGRCHHMAGYPGCTGGCNGRG